MADQLMQHVSISWLLWIGSGLLVHALVYWRQYLPSFTRDVYEYGKLRSESGWSWVSPSLPKRSDIQCINIPLVLLKPLAELWLVLL